MGSCTAPSAKGDDKFITTDYLQQCPFPQQENINLRLLNEGLLIAHNCPSCQLKKQA
uniref:hypothetical protein n=1 Tax=Klebsiella pneumoniae TaxID=573 RepID=UPI003D81B018